MFYLAKQSASSSCAILITPYQKPPMIVPIVAKSIPSLSLMRKCATSANEITKPMFIKYFIFNPFFLSRV